VVQPVVLRRIPRSACANLCIAPHQGGRQGAEEAGDVHGLAGLGGADGFAVAAEPFGRQFAGQTADGASAAVSAFGCAQGTADDEVAHAVAEALQVAHAIRSAGAGGVDDAGSDDVGEFVAQIAAVDGSVDHCAGGIVDDVLADLRDQVGFAADLRQCDKLTVGIGDTDAAGQCVQGASGEHGGGDVTDGFVAPQIAESLAEIALIID
jgi:hypothetical protein